MDMGGTEVLSGKGTGATGVGGADNGGRKESEAARISSKISDMAER